MHNTLDLINLILKELPTPLVGSVAYDGHKETKECTPKAYAAFDECYSLVRPKHILEIGTHAGGSALMALAFTDAKVFSVDIGVNWITPDYSFSTWDRPSTEGGLKQVAYVLTTHFPGRFSLLVGDSTALGTRQIIKQRHAIDPFDFAFIDGDHSYDFVKSDIEFALSLGITNMILDDLNTIDGGEVAKAARELGLTVVKEWQRIHSGGVSFGLVRAG